MAKLSSDAKKALSNMKLDPVLIEKIDKTEACEAFIKMLNELVEKKEKDFVLQFDEKGFNGGKASISPDGTTITVNIGKNFGETYGQIALLTTIVHEVTHATQFLPGAKYTVDESLIAQYTLSEYALLRNQMEGEAIYNEFLVLQALSDANAYERACVAG